MSVLLNEINVVIKIIAGVLWRAQDWNDSNMVNKAPIKHDLLTFAFI